MRYIAILLGLAIHLTIIATDLCAQDVSADIFTRPMELSARVHTEARLQADLVALQQYRPTYPFWRHIFTIPDGRIVYGSAEDGRLLANFPARGNWTSGDVWEDPSLSSILVGRRLPSRLSRRRDEVERLLQSVAGPVVHNPTRGVVSLSTC